MEKGMSKYEQAALVSICKWNNPEKGWFRKTVETINRPVNEALNRGTEIPGIKWVIEKAIGGLIGVLNDFAQWTVRPNSIIQKYRNAGFKKIQKPQDIFTLDLEDADKVCGFLAAKYKVFAAAEGAGAGYIGLPGIPPDIVALVTLNQRAIGEYATYYGFDIASQRERQFA